MLSTVVYLIVRAESHIKDLLGALDYMDSKRDCRFLPPPLPRLLSKYGTGHSFRYADEYAWKSGSQLSLKGKLSAKGRHKLTHPACSGQHNLSSGTVLSLSTFFWHYYTTASSHLLSLSRQ